MYNKRCTQTEYPDGHSYCVHTPLSIFIQAIHTHSCQQVFKISVRFGFTVEDHLAVFVSTLDQSATNVISAVRFDFIQTILRIIRPLRLQDDPPQTGSHHTPELKVKKKKPCISSVNYNQRSNPPAKQYTLNITRTISHSLKPKCLNSLNYMNQEKDVQERIILYYLDKTSQEYSPISQRINSTGK